MTSETEQLVSNAVLANRYVARNIILGDPAVRLRTDAMTA
jgi:hypothetical protein